MSDRPEQLPGGLNAYKRTAVFTDQNLPAGLRRDHSTRTGIWALIHVLEGRLRYCVPAWQLDEVLVPGRPGLVAPQVVHCIEPLGAVKRYVEFHALAVPTQDSPHQPM